MKVPILKKQTFCSKLNAKDDFNTKFPFFFRKSRVCDYKEHNRSFMPWKYWISYPHNIHEGKIISIDNGQHGMAK